MKGSKIEKSLTAENDLEKINRFSRRELSENEVYTFTATLCDNDIDRDFERFSKKALGELAPLFIGKTGISDHSMKSSDQKARIFDTYVEEAAGEKCADGERLFSLKARAYMLRNDENKALIDEIEAGIKKEISVSCQMKKRICSICGRDNSNERCEHIAGKTYGGKLCYKTLEDAVDAYEFSFVAVPAQSKAGVTKAFDIREEKGLEEIIKTLKSAPSSLELNEGEIKSVKNYIENLEDEARLGEEYKKQLAAEVCTLLSKKLPEIDSKLLKSIVSVMTVSELSGFKKGLKSGCEKTPQLLKKKENAEKNDFSQFRI